MSQERKHLTVFLFVLGWFAYAFLYDVYEFKMAWPDAVIICTAQSIMNRDFSDEFKRGCYLKHGYLLEAKTDAH